MINCRLPKVRIIVFWACWCAEARSRERTLVSHPIELVCWLQQLVFAEVPVVICILVKQHHTMQYRRQQTSTHMTTLSRLHASRQSAFHTHKMVEKLPAESDILFAHDAHLPEFEEDKFRLCSEQHVTREYIKQHGGESANGTRCNRSAPGRKETTAGSADLVDSPIPVYIRRHQVLVCDDLPLHQKCKFDVVRENKLLDGGTTRDGNTHFE
jgi:hypothetical protein